MLLFIELSELVYFQVNLIKNKNKTFFKMSRFYERVDMNTIVFMFWTIWNVGFVFNVGFIGLGVYSAFKKNIRVFDFFNLICLIGLLSEMI